MDTLNDFLTEVIENLSTLVDAQFCSIPQKDKKEMFREMPSLFATKPDVFSRALEECQKVPASDDNLIKIVRDFHLLNSESTSKFLDFTAKGRFSDSGPDTVTVLISLRELVKDGMVDPRITVGIAKAIYHARGLIEKIRMEGWKKSDWGRETGSAQHKGYVSYEEVREIARKVAADEKGRKFKSQITRKVMKRIKKGELGNGTHRKGYKYDHVKDNILKDVWPDIL